MEPGRAAQTTKESAEKSAASRQEEARKEQSTSKTASRSLRRATGQRQDTKRKPRANPEPLLDIDWCKFTHFRARHSVKDLERLRRLSRSRSRQNLFDADKPDNTGLWPIHWAAINNRSDMIEFMLKNGAKADKACKNRLMANGTPLHLAAMNGSLEAADALINRGCGDANEPERSNRASPSEQASDTRAGSNLLSLRDADGQTPLMRSAAPRSKRMDTVRDLLRKNFWSLSGRPSEMALLLICYGAKWREREPNQGMNLLHLAAVNDYDDIVSLLLVLDKHLLDVPAANLQLERNEQLPRESSINMDAADGFESVDLSERGPVTLPPPRAAQSDTSSQSSANADQPLIGDSAKAKQIVANGLKPLQLAILYGRVAIISQLWHARQREKYLNSPEGTGASLKRARPMASRGAPLNVQKAAKQEHFLDSKQLKSVLFQATWSNREEFSKVLKAFFLKGILAFDLVLLAGIWAPLYAGTDRTRRLLDGIKGGIFFLSYCMSMALAFRVMLKNPGYLRRNSFQYLDQMSRLMQDLKRDKSSRSSTPTKPLIRLDSSSPESTETLKNPSSKLGVQTSQASQSQAQPFIKTVTKPVDLTPNNLAANSTTDPQNSRKEGSSQRLQIVQAELAKQAPSWQSNFDLKDTVRLLCHKCQCIRRPRSRHCNYCNHCVQDFDHHCIYLGCCIGRQNRLDFLLMLIMMTITGTYGTFLISYSLGRSEWSSFWQVIAFVWVFKWVIIGLLLAFQNMRRACLGVTLYEEIRSKRLRHLFGRLGPSEEISKSHRAFSTLKGSFWRYDPDRFITGDQTTSDIWQNFNEFTNNISCDEYLLSFVCTDTPVARAIATSDPRINNTYRLL